MLPFEDIVRKKLLRTFEEISNGENIEIVPDEGLARVVSKALCCSSMKVVATYINDVKALIELDKTIDIRKAINMLYVTQTPVSKEFVKKVWREIRGRFILDEERKIIKFSQESGEISLNRDDSMLSTTVPSSSMKSRSGRELKTPQHCSQDATTPSSAQRRRRAPNGPPAKSGPSALDYPDNNLGASTSEQRRASLEDEDMEAPEERGGEEADNRLDIGGGLFMENENKMEELDNSLQVYHHDPNDYSGYDPDLYRDSSRSGQRDAHTHSQKHDDAVKHLTGTENTEELLGMDHDHHVVSADGKLNTELSLNHPSGDIEPVLQSEVKPPTPPVSRKSSSNSGDLPDSRPFEDSLNDSNQLSVNGHPTQELSARAANEMDAEDDKRVEATPEPLPSEAPNILQEHPVVQRKEQENRVPATSDPRQQSASNQQNEDINEQNIEAYNASNREATVDDKQKSRMDQEYGVASADSQVNAALSVNDPSGHVAPVSPVKVKSPIPPVSHKCSPNPGDFPEFLQLKDLPNNLNQSFVSNGPTPESSDNGVMDSGDVKRVAATPQLLPSEDPTISQEHPVVLNRKQEDRSPTASESGQLSASSQQNEDIDANDSEVDDETTYEDEEDSCESGEEEGSEGLEDEENEEDEEADVGYNEKTEELPSSDDASSLQPHPVVLKREQEDRSPMASGSRHQAASRQQNGDIDEKDSEIEDESTYEDEEDSSEYSEEGDSEGLEDEESEDDEQEDRSLTTSGSRQLPAWVQRKEDIDSDYSDYEDEENDDIFPPIMETDDGTDSEKERLNETINKVALMCQAERRNSNHSADDDNQPLLDMGQGREQGSFDQEEIENMSSATASTRSSSMESNAGRVDMEHDETHWPSEHDESGDSTTEMAAPDQLDEMDYRNDSVVETTKSSPSVDSKALSDQLDMEQGQAQKGHEHHGIENDSPMIVSPASSGDQPVAPSELQEEGSSVASELALGGSALLSVFAELPKYQNWYENSNVVLGLFQRVMREVDETGLASLINQCHKRTQYFQTGQQVVLNKAVVLLQWCYNCITRKSAMIEFDARQPTPSEVPGAGVQKILEALARNIDLHFNPELAELQRRIEADAAVFKETDFIPTKVLRMVISASDFFMWSSRPRDFCCKIDLPTRDVMPLFILTSKLMDTITSSLTPYCSQFCAQVTTAETSLPPESVTNLNQVFEMTDIVLLMLINRALSYNPTKAVDFPHVARILETILLCLNVMLKDTPRRMKESRKNLTKAMNDLKGHKISVETLELAVQMIIFGCLP